MYNKENTAGWVKVICPGGKNALNDPSLLSLCNFIRGKINIYKSKHLLPLFRKYPPWVYYSLLVSIRSWRWSKIVNKWRWNNNVDPFLTCRLVKIIVLSLNDLNKWSHSYPLHLQEGLLPKLTGFVFLLVLKKRLKRTTDRSVLLCNLWLISSTGGSSEAVEKNCGRGKDQLSSSPARRPPLLQEVQDCGSCRSSGDQLKKKTFKNLNHVSFDLSHSLTHTQCAEFFNLSSTRKTQHEFKTVKAIVEL